MGSRKPIATSRYHFGLFLFPGLLLTTAGCVFGNDSDPPKLSIDLYWGTQASNSRYSDGYCEDANVSRMDWTVKDASDRVVTKSDGEIKCAVGLDLVGLEPGTYTVVVNGYDSNDNQILTGTCDGLTLDRFDNLYSCDVDQDTSNQQQ